MITRHCEVARMLGFLGTGGELFEPSPVSGSER